MHAGGGGLSAAEKGKQKADDAELPGAGGLSAAEKGKQKADDAELPGAGGLSAAEKGKQKADDADLPSAGAGAGVLRPALGLRRALFSSTTTEIEEAPPSPPPPSSCLLTVSQLERNQATLDCLQAELQQLRGGLGVGEGSSSKCLQGGKPRPGDEARWCAGAGVPRHPLGPSSAASEIEEAPPSPPPLSRLLALNAARGPGGLAAATSGPAASLADELQRKRAALALMVSQLQQQRRERGEEGGSRRPEGEPRQDAGPAAGIQMLEHELGTIHESLNSWRDRMVALRLQEEELRAFTESLKAWEDFWKPVPVPQRKNSKVGGTCNWKRIISAITFASGIAFCRQLYGTSRTIKGFSRHVARLLCVCFLLIVLYVLYLVLRLLGGTFTGLLGKRP
nr:uncharacterized protein LOC117843975 [Setaria viridis]